MTADPRLSEEYDDLHGATSAEQVLQHNKVLKRFMNKRAGVTMEDYIIAMCPPIYRPHDAKPAVDEAITFLLQRR